MKKLLLIALVCKGTLIDAAQKESKELHAEQERRHRELREYEIRREKREEETTNWVEEVFKKLPDKWDRLALLNYLYDLVVVAYDKHLGKKSVHEVTGKHSIFWATSQQYAINQLVNKIPGSPNSYFDLRRYYQELYDRIGIPTDYLIYFSKDGCKHLPRYIE